MVSAHKLKFLYVVGVLALCTLIGLSWLYEHALTQADQHLLKTQAELISSKFKRDLANSEFRQIADAFGTELPDHSFEVLNREGHSIFRSQATYISDRCSQSSLIDGRYIVKVCRLHGPWENLLQQIQRRAKVFIAIASVLLLGAIVYFIKVIRKSIYASIVSISKATDNIPIDESAPLEGLLSHLAQQKERIKEFETTVAASSRLAAIGAVTAQFQHDVNNPLSLISFALNRIDQNPELLTVAKEAALRIKTMVSDMGQYSQSFKVSLTEVDLNEVASAAAEEIKTQNPDFVINIECPSSVRVKADPVALIRVFSNLFKNAFEAQSASVTLSVYEDARLGKVRVEVSDWGTGIKAELKEKLMKPFATFGKSKGTGLGLWHASQVVSAMGGAFDLASPGRGSASTTVTLVLSAVT